MPTRVLLVGAGGYGGLYVNATLTNPQRPIEVVGVVDPYAAASANYGLITQKQVPVYDTVEAFYAASAADLAVIATPLQFHAQQACYCLNHGSHVFIEKPIAPNMAQAREMTAARDATGKMLGIGYQWCYDPAMLALKADIEQGLLGAPVRLRAMVLAPRDRIYYRRGLGWAGKKHDAQGNPIFDSVAANATGHSLENMLWMIGEGFEGAKIERLEAETARANDIEMYDTSIIRIGTGNGAVLHFVVSHAAGREHQQNPIFEYEFENATVSYSEEDGRRIRAQFKDGHEKVYGASDAGNPNMPKLWMFMDATEGKALLPCPAEAAMAHTLAMDQCLEACPQPYVFSAAEYVEDGEMLWVPGLAKTLWACYDNWKLPSELGGWLNA